MGLRLAGDAAEAVPSSGQHRGLIGTRLPAFAIRSVRGGGVVGEPVESGEAVVPPAERLVNLTKHNVMLASQAQPLNRSYGASE